MISTIRVFLFLNQQILVKEDGYTKVAREDLRQRRMFALQHKQTISFLGSCKLQESQVLDQ